MGRLLTAALAAWAGRRVSKVEQLGRDPVAARRRTLNDLLHAGAGTSFGKAHGFRHIRTHADFAAQVPVRRYVDFLNWIERQLAGEADVCWPGRPRYFAKTSGF